MPSPALVQPVRDSLAAVAERLTREARDAAEGDTPVDDESFRLETMLRVAERLAETTGADLGASLDVVAEAVALYPRSDTAHWFPAKLAAAKARIATVLAERRP